MIFRRYTSISIYISIIFVCAFLALFNGFLMIVKFENKVRREQKYLYRYEAEVYLVTDEIFPKQLLRLTEGIKECNIIIEGLRFFYDGWNGIYKPDIYLVENENLQFPVKNNIKHIPNGGIIVPDNVPISGKILKCHGVEIQIADYIDTNAFSDGAGTFLLNAEDYFEIFPDVITKGELCMRVVSNKENVYNTCQVLKENLEKYFPDCQIVLQEIEREMPGLSDALMNETVLNSFLLYGFALINSMIISYYWVNIRRREIAIRKAYGSNNLTIGFLLERELLMIVGIAAIIAFGMEVVFQLAMGDSEDIFTYMSIGLGYLVLIILSTLFAMIIPMRSIMKIQPSEGVKLC